MFAQVMPRVLESAAEMPSRTLKSGSGQQTNLTPMIDVVFQLIIFFLLVAQFSRQQTIELTLPSVSNRESEQIKGESRAIINVVPREQVARLGGDYRLGSLSFDATPQGIERLAEVLRSIKRRMPECKVYIRAGRIESYERVHPAMQAVTLAGLSDMELVTIPPDALGN